MPRRRRAGTLVDVARRCSVAPSTVSRVLNNSQDGRFSVSTAVREKILRIAKELDYRPSMAARNLAVSKTHLVAVLGLQEIVSDRVGPTERAVSAMSIGLDEAGYDLCLPLLSRRHDPFDMPGLRVDGVVLAAAVRPKHLDAVERAGVPYVSLNGVLGPSGSLVAPDDAGGMQLALEHLVSLGHRRIAYMDYPAEDGEHPSIPERREAFDRLGPVLKFQSTAIHLPLLKPRASWNEFYPQFLQRAVSAGATAVITYSHQMALSVLRIAHQMKLSIPRDLSLVTFNDEPMISLMVPAITAVRVPDEEMGRMAAEMLLEQMESDKPPAQQRRILPETLIARETTAPPAQG